MKMLAESDKASRWRSSCASVFSSFAPGPGFGQTSSGQSIFATVVGTVSDSTSAVIPNTRITVTNVSPKEKREFTTSESGRYEINNLLPGVYMLEAEIAGFSKFRPGPWRLLDLTVLYDITEY